MVFGFGVDFVQRMPCFYNYISVYTWSVLCKTGTLLPVY